LSDNPDHDAQARLQMQALQNARALLDKLEDRGGDERPLVIVVIAVAIVFVAVVLLALLLTKSHRAGVEMKAPPKSQESQAAPPKGPLPWPPQEVPAQPPASPKPQ